MDVDAAAESTGPAVFTSGCLSHEECASELIQSEQHAASRDDCRVSVTHHDLRYAKPESDAFYGSINVGGLKKKRSSNNVSYKICVLFCND
jgi:hypothetical protein